MQANVAADMQMLVNRFEQAGGCKFGDFVTAWRELKFSFIFDGARGGDEYRELVETLYSSAKKFLWSAKTETRLAAVFALYVLYRVQPQLSSTGAVLRRMAIPISPAELQTIVTLHKQLDSETTAEWDEALLVLHWLHRVKPFRYIAGVVFEKSIGNCDLVDEPRSSTAHLEEVHVADTVSSAVAMVQLRRHNMQYLKSLQKIDALEWEQPERHSEFIEKLPQKIEQLMKKAPPLNLGAPAEVINLSQVVPATASTEQTTTEPTEDNSLEEALEAELLALQQSSQ